MKNVTKSIVVTNMDGLEYKRTKFNKWVRKFVFWEERMAVKQSHYLIVDNMGIHDYYKEKYGKDSKFLAYGADIHDDYNGEHLFEIRNDKNISNLFVLKLLPWEQDGYEHGCHQFGLAATIYLRI